TDGQLVAEDELLVNSGGNRFQVQLIEPRRGQSYQKSLLAKAEVDLPEGRTLERLEIYLNESLVATLYQPPFTQPVALPSEEEISFIRAVAYLPDGNSTEDLVFINAPEYLEEVEVQFVELYTTVFNQDGRPVQGLSREDFQVLEDGVEQKLMRFDAVTDLPIHVGIVLDNSGSMRESLQQTKTAALSFFRQVVGSQDRAAVITFNRLPVLAVKLTNDLPTLGAGLAGLTAEGETALYDSLMFSLYYFTGIKGQRALLLLSDGKDEISRFGFDETLEYARRAGITIYPIGLQLRDFEARRNLQQLADETGGRAFFIGDITQLDQIYELVQQDLRSQYLLAYQSSNTDDSGDFRSIEVRAKPSGLEAKTISGYYP
ncbi:MAG: VWA domain-containing protein, partial [Acidobacteriota bacterium]|nr:VWA domain-containing protein [Acidobacteriota bacterium]